MLKTIAVDAMGGDNAPDAIVKGSVLALQAYEDVKIQLVGETQKIENILQSLTYDANRLEIIHAPETISSHDNPTQAIRDKKDSSMVKGMALVKEEKASAFVSAGNTGALLAGSTVIIGRIKGISRPALGTVLPTSKGSVFLLDSGANVDCKPSYLEQFAKMGSVYAEYVLKIENPKVGLVNVGAEKEKGDVLSKEAFSLLEEDKTIHFIGNVEARDIPDGVCDVLVCDGFVGNVILKLAEGLSTMLMGTIKNEILSGFVTKLGGVLLVPVFKKLKKKFDYREAGGAPFLGLKALVVKAHGSSDEIAIKNAIHQCRLFIENDIVHKIEEML